MPEALGSSPGGAVHTGIAAGGRETHSAASQGPPAFGGHGGAKVREPPPGELGRPPVGIARERETNADDPGPANVRSAPSLARDGPTATPRYP